jgi:hypothetical protein
MLQLPIKEKLPKDLKFEYPGKMVQLYIKKYFENSEEIFSYCKITDYGKNKLNKRKHLDEKVLLLFAILDTSKDNKNINKWNNFEFEHDKFFEDFFKEKFFESYTKIDVKKAIAILINEHYEKLLKYHFHILDLTNL